jgi:hypothetical protein
MPRYCGLAFGSAAGMSQPFVWFVVLTFGFAAA